MFVAGRSGQPLTVQMRVSAVGDRAPTIVYVNFYASTDTQITGQDYRLGRASLAMSVNSWATITLRGTFPTDIPAGTYAVGWIIDPENIEDETNESNNVAYDASSLLTVADAPQMPVICVDADARGTGDGSSWENAFLHLQDALAAAAMGCEIRVAAGVYTPDRGAGMIRGDRCATFDLKNGVTILGGYAGAGEPDPNARDTGVCRTILSGDLNGDDLPVGAPGELWIEVTRMDNSLHVVTAIDVGRATLVDGVRIVGGCADGQFEAATPRDSQGAGMYISGGGPRLQGCVFSGNWAARDGGAVYTTGSNPEFLRCTYYENAAGASPQECRGAGGAVFSTAGGLTLVNCTFNGNSSTGSGGALANSGGRLSAVNSCFHANYGSLLAGAIDNIDGSQASLINCTLAANRQDLPTGVVVCESSGEHSPSELHLANCILWDEGPEIVSRGAAIITAVFSDIRGGWFDTGNIQADPRFADPAGPDGLPGTEDDNLRLREDSPCIDAGNTDLLPADASDVDGDGNVAEPLPLDRDSVERTMGSAVDIGAYEATIR